MEMETSIPSIASSSLFLSLSLQLHCFPPNAIANTTTNHSSFHVFKFRPSAQSLSISTEAPATHHGEAAPKISTTTTKKMTKPFAERDAFPPSLPLDNKNPRTIYKDIRKLARQHKLKEALTILGYMDQQCIPVNPTTFSSLISACIRTKSLSQGRKIHSHIRINGLENNEFLRTKLVHMYTSCGAMEDAKELFNERFTGSVYPWNALLRGTGISGNRQYRDLLSAYSEMRALGIELNEYSFSSVIKSFAGAAALSQGLKTHALLIKNGFADSTILQTSLIDMYFKCGKIKLACQVFEEMSERDVVVWGAMIAGFTHKKMQKEALENVRLMLGEGVKPNSVLMTIILPAIGQVSSRRLGQEIHANLVKTKSYSKQVSIQSALIDMYCKCGDISSGRRVFYSSMERNVVCWTALMSGYAYSGRLEQAMRSTIWMQQEGFRPDLVTVATVLPICAHLRALKQGKEIHAYALKHWFLPHVSIISSLMVMYSKCAMIEYSIKLFDGMEQRNVILWTAMIDSYIENECLYEALDVIRSMQLSKHKPDSVTIARMLSVSGKLRLVKLGKEIHGQVLKRGFAAVHYVSAEIVDMYGTCGFVDRAELVFDAVPFKGSMTWTALIRAYGYKEMYDDAIVLFDRMRSNDCSPNHFTFEAVLSICDRAGFVEDAFRIFNLMSVYKIEVSEEHCTIMIRLLTRYGKLDEAQRFVEMIYSL